MDNLKRLLVILILSMILINGYIITGEIAWFGVLVPEKEIFSWI